jgi:hypothetical protein
LQPHASVLDRSRIPLWLSSLAVRRSGTPRG